MNRPHRTLVASLTLVVLFTGAAAAQCYPVPLSPSYGGYGPGYWGYHHASTYEEGVLRGSADYLRAVGEAQYWNSMALINGEQARRDYLANRQLKAEAFASRRAINRGARAAERSGPLSFEQYVALAKKLAPDRLNDHQYDRMLGRLSWPAALQDHVFAAQRAALDAAFAARSPGDVGNGSAFHVRVRTLTAAGQESLLRRKASLDPWELLAAQKFLASLAYEAQQPQSTKLAAAK